LIGLEHKAICPTLKDYNFGTANQEIAQKLQEALTKIAEQVHEDPVLSDDEDDLLEEHGDGGIDFPGDGYPQDDPEQERLNEPTAENIALQRQSTVGGLAFAMSESHDNMFSYFDTKLNQNWVGPEHWKVRSYRARGPVTDTSRHSRPKSAKKETTIDFANYELDLKTLFSKGTATITLSKTAITERSEQNNLLPEDLHFSSSDLLCLFTKPSWKVLQDLGLV